MLWGSQGNLGVVLAQRQAVLAHSLPPTPGEGAAAPGEPAAEGGGRAAPQAEGGGGQAAAAGGGEAVSALAPCSPPQPRWAPVTSLCARRKREERLRKVLQARERVEQMKEEKKKQIEQKFAQIDEKTEKVRAWAVGGSSVDWTHGDLTGLQPHVLLLSVTGPGVCSEPCGGWKVCSGASTTLHPWQDCLLAAPSLGLREQAGSTGTRRIRHAECRAPLRRVE